MIEARATKISSILLVLIAIIVWIVVLVTGCASPLPTQSPHSPIVDLAQKGGVVVEKVFSGWYNVYRIIDYDNNVICYSTGSNSISCLKLDSE